MSELEKTLEEKWSLIESIDLMEVKKKLKTSKSWIWRQKNNIDKVENEYRQFLYLLAINPGETVIPWTQALDDLWHQHILDTKKYREDCDLIFGKFIDHNPHLPKGTSSHDKAWKKTKKMYQDAFKYRSKDKNKKVTESEHPGCGTTFIPVFCGTNSSSDYSSHTSSTSSCGTSSSDSGGSSDGGSGCGSSCGSGCGGGCGS